MARTRKHEELKALKEQVDSLNDLVRHTQAANLKLHGDLFLLSGELTNARSEAQYLRDLAVSLEKQSTLRRGITMGLRDAIRIHANAAFAGPVSDEEAE